MKVYVDLDQTLSDLVSTILMMIHLKFGKLYTLKDVKSYGWLQEQISPEIASWYIKEGLYDSVPIFPQSQWFINALLKDYDLTIITHSHPKIAEEKRKYIKQWFNIGPERVICTHESKHLSMEKGSVLVDDYLLNIQPHVYYNDGYGILFNHFNESNWANYDPNGIRTERHLFATSFYEVLQILKGLNHDQAV